MRSQRRSVATRIALVAATAVSVATATGCSVEAGPSPVPVVATTTGTLTLDWTINGTKDPNQCSQGAAATLDVTVDDASGGFVGEFQQACDAFATSIDLPPGSYVADAVLVDAQGADRTTAVPIDLFTIRGSDDLNVPIDFPASSFR